ncbi:MAG TPA: hypothetical protein VH682_28505 [Gemmataceae bacterium]
MPCVVNAQLCWKKWICDHKNIIESDALRVPKNRKDQLNNMNTYFYGSPLPKNQEEVMNKFDPYERMGNLDAISRFSQFERDAGFWYGALVYPGSSDRTTLAKVFAILYYGGLMVRRGGGWVTWQSLRIPIAAAISHSARVLVQLPRLNLQDPNSNIWGWLNSEDSIHERGAATHGIEYVKGEMVNNVPKNVKERKAKTGMRDDHYYTKVALGGSGYYNPFSGNKIDAEGQHGHLYFCYKAPTAEKVGGLLISTEQSAPADVMLPANAGKLAVLALAKQGVDDQWGGTHGLGGHNTYSATGGNDWTKDRLVGVGPDQYLDGMYVDLSQPYQYNHVRDNWVGFRPEKVGWTGKEPPLALAPPRPRQPAPQQRPLNRPLFGN